jgi:hypothetical protein
MIRIINNSLLRKLQRISHHETRLGAPLLQNYIAYQMMVQAWDKEPRAIDHLRQKY